MIPISPDGRYHYLFTYETAHGKGNGAFDRIEPILSANYTDAFASYFAEIHGVATGYVVTSVTILAVPAA